MAGPEVLTLSDYVDAIAEALGRQSPAVPAGPAALQAAGLGTFAPPFAGTRFIMDTGRIRRELGFQPTPLANWLPLTVRWFVEEYRGRDSARYAQRSRELKASSVMSTYSGYGYRASSALGRLSGLASCLTTAGSPEEAGGRRRSAERKGALIEKRQREPPLVAPFHPASPG